MSVTLSLDFSLENLSHLEKDLSLPEKISLLFLLHGMQDTSYVLERLVLETQNPFKVDTNYLKEWAQKYPTNWKETLLEALTIIQANQVLEKLGQNPEYLKRHYLPEIPAVGLFIPLELKILYHICENTPEKLASKLMKYLKKQVGDVQYLEICFLYLLLESFGSSIDNKNNASKYDLKMLALYFKENEFYEFEDLLNRLNKSIAASKLNHNVTTKNLIYKVSRNTIGNVLVINQRDFHMDINKELAHLLPKTAFKKRLGTDIDRDRIATIFAKFGYKIMIENNLKHSSIIKAIKNVVELSSNSDSLVVVILSHGQKGTIYGCNSIPVKVNDIKDTIASKQLLGIPKLLFIQACQGDVLHCAEKFNKHEVDGDSVTKLNGNEPRLCDMIVSWSTIPGYASIRHIEKGSWFIQDVCDKIEELYKKEHLQDILTAVIHDVSNKRGYSEECMIPIIHSTLRKKFYFPR